MTMQNYCMVNETTAVCENVCFWDGNTDTWSPPPGYLMLEQATTPTKVWAWNDTDKVWFLEAQSGQGQIGFIWDGVFLITNEPEPAHALQVPVQGAQTL